MVGDHEIECVHIAESYSGMRTHIPSTPFVCVDGQMSFLEESRAPNRLALDAHVDLNVQLSI